MYCPKCGARNSEEAKFCRSCGTNLSLVPQAISGRLPESKRPHGRRSRDRDGETGLASGLTKAFMGVGFLLVTVILIWRMRQWWGVWFLIPAFSLLGKGVAEIVTDLQRQKMAQATTSPMAAPPTTAPIEERPFEGGPREIPSPPPSVTENTTRQLDPTTHSRRDA